jgi:gliding motility-associated-like protein
MKLRYFLILIMSLFSISARAQPAETIYLGSVIKSGYADDESYGPFNIGFNFSFYGNTYSQFYVNSNGLVLFGAGSAESTEAPIPTAAAPNNFIAPLWDDLIIDNTGKILYTTVGAAPNRKLIIQATNMGFYPNPVFMGTYLVILYESTNKIQVQYRIIIDATSARAHGGSATIGIENAGGTAGVQYAYHSSNAISTGKAISFTPSGPTYILDSDVIYDGAVLTTNLSLPDPSIPSLLSPPQNGIIGSNFNFEWAQSVNASSYTLSISHYSDLGDATVYNVGSNLSCNVTGLALDTAYYWGVFATNTTGETWCEIKKFRTSSSPPLAAVPQTVWVELNQEKTIDLNYTGGDASAKTAIITSLPVHGQLYYSISGVKGALISSVPVTLSDADNNVIYVANGTSGNGAGNFNFKVHDDTGDSPVVQVTINVSPPGMPSLLYTGKATTNVEMQFDRIMSDPAGKEGQFAVTVNSTPVTLSSLSLKTGDPYTIVATFASPILITDAVTIAYTAGTITSSMGGFLASFNSQTVSLKAQIITFTTNLIKKYGDAPVSLTATSNSGLSLTYSSSNLSVATISGSALTILNVGSSDITARQAGNGTWAPAKYARTLTVAKGDQTISFGALAVKTYGDGDFAISATSNSGLSISFSSSYPSVATIAGNIVHIVSAGTSVITASQAGNSLWNPATDVQQTLTVNKADQTISFSTLSSKTCGDADFSLSASASSGLSVSFTSSNPAVATIAGNVVHIAGAGISVITALQAGNANYNAAPDVQQTLTVNKANQTITFSVLPAKTYGDADFSLSATSSSGLNVTFAGDNPAVATVTGNTVHIVASGTAVITASQAGDANYNAAADVQQTLTVIKANQTISFSALPTKVYGDADLTLSATASSGLSVTFASGNTAVATVIGTSVHIVGAGTSVISASQAGDANYNAAPDVLQTLTVSKANQTISFTALPAKTFADADFTISATASSGLSISFSSGNTAVATVTGNTIHIVGAGAAIITASQAGNINYNAAPDVQQTLTVTRLLQTITFTDSPARLLVQDSYTLVATSSAGLTVLFESKDISLATVTGNQVTGVAKGDVQIRAYSNGDQNYESAEAFVTVEVYSTHKDIMYLFTPNNDGINDLWELPELSTWGKCDVRVFNRWGKLVFASPDYHNEWNGMSDGNPVPEGAYYFVIKTENAGIVKGTVNLVR